MRIRRVPVTWREMVRAESDWDWLTERGCLRCEEPLVVELDTNTRQCIGCGSMFMKPCRGFAKVESGRSGGRI